MEKFDGEVVFEWTPSRRLRKNVANDVAQAYVVVLNAKAANGVIVYAKYNDKWEANPFNLRTLVAELLRRKDGLSSALEEAINIIKDSTSCESDECPTSTGDDWNEDEACDRCKEIDGLAVDLQNYC